MSQIISAIYDSGVFRPLGPVDLANGTQVEIQVAAPSADVSDELGEATRLAWVAYLKRMESLPDNSPADGLSGRDHDRILYGE